jgi:D-lactate dehydrogenase (cytochrome)
MDTQKTLDDLHTCLGQRLSRSKSDLDLHGASESYFPPSPPDAVAYPETTAEVAQIIAICARHRFPAVWWWISAA